MVHKYKLLIVSKIGVYSKNGINSSLDLWVRDISVNSKYVKELCILCPRLNKKQASWCIIPPSITVRFLEDFKHKRKLKCFLEEFDVIQINTGRPFWQSRKEILILKTARKLDKVIVTSISSDRAKTTVLNSQNCNILKRIKARIISFSIYQTSRKMVLGSSGVLLTGHGLVKDYSFGMKNFHVGVASWINASDIISAELLLNKLTTKKELNLCVATRLEPMKGVHLAIQALGILKNNFKILTSLNIYGKGGELTNLKLLATQQQVSESTHFLGTVPYGEIFFSEIRKNDLMLFTNLNIEQPRLIFDALSQGLLPICPDVTPYKELIPYSLLRYKQGDFKDLARCIKQFTDKDIYREYIDKTKKLLDEFNADTMHERRGSYIKKLLSDQ